MAHDALDQVAERRLAAVLFSDIRDFTTISEQSDPEALVARLNEYFDAMLQPIAEHGGVVMTPGSEPPEGLSEDLIRRLEELGYL